MAVDCMRPICFLKYFKLLCLLQYTESLRGRNLSLVKSDEKNPNNTAGFSGNCQVAR